MNDYRRHEGVDISAELGNEVCAFASGTVLQIYTDPYMGKTVVIEHDGGLSSRYANLSDAVVPELQVGSTVNVGDVIGLVGDTAMVECGEEPHLHFEVFYNGESIDPIAYFEDTK
jgi:murein DD-endopeptidase MepM/ murein hydrolase activator NlpD